MNDNRGFSLVELVVAVGIMSVLLALLTTMMTSAARYFEKQNAAVELNNEAQIIINYLSETVMEATDMNFIITDPTTGAGRYEFFAVDPTTGTATAKGDQRYIYFLDGKLYMVTFNSGEVPPANPTGVDADNIYLISDEIKNLNVTVDLASVLIDPPDPLNPGATETVVKNPVTVRIVFEMEHNGARSEFEIEANCRNRIDDYVITEAGNPPVTYRAVNR